MSIFKLTDQYLVELEKAISGKCESLLDLGCGPNSPVRLFSDRIRTTVGVDAYGPSLEASKAKGIHGRYVQCNLVDIESEFEAKSFDCVLLSDIVEHFRKDDGDKIIRSAERLARKQVVIFTTNGFVPQDEVDGNPYQRHLSGWTPEEMRARDYSVIGIGGLKWFRKEQAIFRWPAALVSRLSQISESFVTRDPKYAFSILCVKTFG